MLGVALQDVCLLVFMARMDWDKETENVGITKADNVVVVRNIAYKREQSVP